ncbi:prepilin-type N-terminal cleavage/methylation domain-containing protein [Lentilactobacillus hilgardii]|nr:prepilin-type N-terminal cleavage/methylation domain-containing protein [Lentilactobacillus hilgardii]KRK59085.1 hypothetical protein FD42_GL000772 [Lentilactobacillus hilgardii DSM 20176 = ATCC 8290]
MTGRKGFTVLELIIYLGIVSCVLLINLVLISFIKGNHIENRLFWHSFQECWTQAQQTARVNHCKYEVMIETESQQVVFKPYHPKIRKQVLKCPNGLVPHNARHLFINSNGYASPTTIYWQSKSGKEIYLQKIQLGWSGFRIEKKN